MLCVKFSCLCSVNSVLGLVFLGRYLVWVLNGNCVIGLKIW